MLDFLERFCKNKSQTGGTNMAKIATTQKNGQSRKTMTLGRPGFTTKERQEIEKLAYQFYVNRGYKHGHDAADWLKAEAIVRNKRS